MAERVTSFTRRRPSGWPISMHVVALGGGDVLVHSPTWLGDDTFDRIEAVGTPRLLFAPNHFHHLDLARFRQRWPDAMAIASSGAIPRLRDKGHDGLTPLEDALLPDGMQWLVPDGTKSGEAWLAISDTWLLCDGFFNETRPIRGLEGALLRLGRIAPGLSIGSTFTLMCIEDPARYRAWVLDALERHRPARAHFSHGEPLVEDAATALAAAVRRRLGE